MGSSSYAGGIYTNSGAYSLSHGFYCNYYVEPGTYCACFGLNCNTPVNSSFACGQYNIGEGKIFSVGNGSNEEDGIIRSNIFDIDTSGKATFYGDLQIGLSPIQNNITEDSGEFLPNNNIVLTPILYDNNGKNEYRSKIYEFYYKLPKGNYKIGLFDVTSSINFYTSTDIKSNLTTKNKFIKHNVTSDYEDYNICFTCNFTNELPKLCKLYVIKS